MYTFNFTKHNIDIFNEASLIKNRYGTYTTKSKPIKTIKQSGIIIRRRGDRLLYKRNNCLLNDRQINDVLYNVTKNWDSALLIVSKEVYGILWKIGVPCIKPYKQVVNKKGEIIGCGCFIFGNLKVTYRELNAKKDFVVSRYNQ